MPRCGSFPSVLLPPPMHQPRAIDILIRLVESSGAEVHVTILLHGVPVEGKLTSTLRFNRWAKETLQISAATGSTIPAGESEPPRRDEAKAIKDRLDQDPMSETGRFEETCLRDAIVKAGPRSTWQTYPYLLVAAGNIDAVTLGGSGT